MRQFIYGRFDVNQGVRGYEIFDRDRAVSREVVKSLAGLFSTKDPDGDLLRVLGPFYLYFPISDGTWVFARGGYEERGNYYSYILRGVLLDEDERAALDYNPFSLAGLLDPNVGDHRRLPEQALPDLHRGVIAPHPAQALQRLKVGLLHYAAGDMACHVLEAPDLHGAAIDFRYDRRLDADFWLLCYQLLPRGVRRELSLSSLASFLDRPTHLSGQFGKPNVSVDLDQPRRTEPGRFLNDTAARDQAAMVEAFDILEAAKRDASFLWNKQRQASPKDTPAFPGWYLNYVKGVFKGMEKDAVSSLEWWKQTPAHVNLFPKKVNHYLRVRNRLAGEITTWFPNLDRDILNDLKENFKSLAADAQPDELAAIGKYMTEVVTLLRVVQKGDLAAELLENRGLAGQWLPRIDDQVLTAALDRAQSDPLTFQHLLTNVLSHVKAWRPALDHLWTMPTLFLCPPALHARLLDMLPAKQSSHFYIEALCDHRYLKMPADFSALYQGLHNKKLLVRFINHFRKKIIEGGPHRDHWFQLLAIARELDQAATREACKNWINHRYSEFFLSGLPRHPALCDFLIDTWLESARDDRALLRTGLLITKRGPAGSHLLRQNPRMAHALKSNKLFEILLHAT